jgi:hypothetical protein
VSEFGFSNTSNPNQFNAPKEDAIYATSVYSLSQKIMLAVLKAQHLYIVRAPKLHRFGVE